MLETYFQENFCNQGRNEGKRWIGHQEDEETNFQENFRDQKRNEGKLIHDMVENLHEYYIPERGDEGGGKQGF